MVKKKKKKYKKILKNKSLLIGIRYLVLLGLMFTLPLIYKIFSILTIYPLAGLLKLFYQVSIYKDVIIINFETPIHLISACIAGSAYLLLLILNLSVPMHWKKRIYSIALSFAMLLALNILRIFILAVLLVNDFQFFDFTHKFFWYVLSIVFVIGIWFLMIKIFNIKEIPAYTDIKYLMKKAKRKKKK